MAVIKHNELFDFPAYEAAIKEVKESTRDFGKSAEEVIKRLKVQQKDLNDTLGQYASQLRNFNVTTNDAATLLKVYARNIDEVNGRLDDYKALQDGVEAVTKSNKAAVLELTRQYKQLLAAQEALNPASASYKEEARKINDQIKQLIPGIKAYNAALNSSKNSVQAAEGSYAALQRRLTELRKQLRELPGAFDPFTGNLNKSNREAVALQRQIENLDRTLKKADSQMGIYGRNVGNYASAFKGFAGQIGALVGITSAFEVGRFIFDVNREFEGLNRAILNVSGTQEEFARNTEFLTTVAEKYGLEIAGLTLSFKNFFAAGTQAGLSTKATRDIFEQVSNVAANLALTQEQVNGVFTAFGQIASKGKVQAEELRGQIGERIPGAFAIAARAIGVTQQELDQMLKKGEVIAGEFLPKFAEELERTFGKEEKVETLTAAVNRLFNTFKELAQSDTFTTIAAKIIDLVNQSVKGLIILGEEVGSAFSSFFDSFKSVDELRAQENQKAAKRAAEEKRIRQDEIDGRIAAFKANTNLVEKERVLELQRARVYELATKFGKAKGQELRDQLRQNLELEKAVLDGFEAKAAPQATKPTGSSSRPKGPSAAELAERAARQQQDFLKKAANLDITQYELLLSQKIITEEEFQKEKLRIMQIYLDKAIAIENGLGAGADGGKVAGFQKERVEAEISFNNFKNKLNEERQEKERKGLQDGIKRNKAQLDQIGKDKKEALEAAFQEEINAEEKSFALLSNARDTTFREEMEHLDRMAAIKRKYGKDASEEEIKRALETAEKRRLIEAATNDLIIEGLSSAVQIVQDQFSAASDERLAKLDRERERELQAAGNNAAARQAIEDRYNKKLIEEKKRQAKQDKLLSLFRIAINTAEGVTRQWANNTPFLIPFVIASGAIQAAVVAARPIPAFRKGTKNAPAGLAIVGEEGPELIEKNGRMFITPGKASFTRLTGGEKIYTAKETERIIERAEKQQVINNIAGSDASALKSAMQITAAREVHTREVMRETMRLNQGQMQQAFNEAVSRIPVNETNWDERGIIKRQRTLNSSITHLNSRLI